VCGRPDPHTQKAHLLIGWLLNGLLFPGGFFRPDTFPQKCKYFVFSLVDVID